MTKLLLLGIFGNFLLIFFYFWALLIMGHFLFWGTFDFGALWIWIWIGLCLDWVELSLCPVPEA